MYHTWAKATIGAAAALVLAGAAQAGEPEYWSVVGVAPDDVLNIREHPSAEADSWAPFHLIAAAFAALAVWPHPQRDDSGAGSSMAKQTGGCARDTSVARPRVRYESALSPVPVFALVRSPAFLRILAVFLSAGMAVANGQVWPAEEISVPLAAASYPAQATQEAASQSSREDLQGSEPRGMYAGPPVSSSEAPERELALRPSEPLLSA